MLSQSRRIPKTCSQDPRRYAGIDQVLFICNVDKIISNSILKNYFPLLMP